MPDRIFFDIYAERLLIESPIYIMSSAFIFLLWRLGADHRKARLFGIVGLSLIIFGHLIEPVCNRIIWDHIHDLAAIDRDRLVAKYIVTYNFILTFYRASSIGLIVYGLLLALRKSSTSRDNI